MSLINRELHFAQVALTDIPHFEHSYVAILPPLKLRGVLLPGAPDRAFLIKIKQREQIYHLQL